MKKGTQKITILFVLIFFLSSFITFIVDEKNLGVKDLPNDFGSDSSILLVQKQNMEDYDKYMIKHFNDCYFGKYLLMDFDKTKDLLKTDYADKKKYRYVFYMDNDRTVLPNGKISVAMVVSYYVQDRKSGRKHSLKRSSSAYGALMKSFIKDLEEARVLRNTKK